MPASEGRGARRARRVQGGMTVAEALIALGLFGLVLTVVGQLTVTAWRVHTRTGDRASVFRGATVAADRLARELRLCQELYSPAQPAGGWDYAQDYRAAAGQTLALVFRRRDPATGDPMVVGYLYDSSQRTMTRVLYQPDFDPARPATWRVREDRLLASRIDGLSLRLLDPAGRYGAPFARFEMALFAEPEGSAPDATPTPMPGSPISVEVRVKGL